MFSIGKASQGTSVKGFELSEYRGVLSPLFCAALTVTYDAICILFKCFHLSMLLSDWVKTIDALIDFDQIHT